jgi:hypothetical protein
MNVQKSQRLKDSLKLIISYPKDKLLLKINNLTKIVHKSEKDKYVSNLYTLLYNAKCVNPNITIDEVIQLKEANIINDIEITTNDKLLTGLNNISNPSNIIQQTPKIKGSNETEDNNTMKSDMATSSEDLILKQNIGSHNIGDFSNFPEFNKNISNNPENEFIKRKTQRQEADPLDVSTRRDYKGEFLRSERETEKNKSDNIALQNNTMINKIEQTANQNNSNIITSKPLLYTNIIAKGEDLKPSKTKTKRTAVMTFNPQFYIKPKQNNKTEMESEFKNFLSELDK